ncbi:MAG: DUF1905 domain-containing protein [Bacteroidetes bacterium]|nr:DUF1905 domain-containing protein [Bacteroidota bacterium]
MATKNKQIEFEAVLYKFDKKGEKTGWTYIEIPADLASEISEGTRKSFRVKGSIDKFKISGVALLPMGEGDFILPVNNEMRKGIGKREGAHVHVKLMTDKIAYELNADLVECLNDDEMASKTFYAMPQSHQNYYSKWVDSAKTDATKGVRISKIVIGMNRGYTFREILQMGK